MLTAAKVLFCFAACLSESKEAHTKQVFSLDYLAPLAARWTHMASGQNLPFGSSGACRHCSVLDVTSKAAWGLCASSRQAGNGTGCLWVHVRWRRLVSEVSAVPQSQPAARVLRSWAGTPAGRTPATSRYLESRCQLECSLVSREGLSRCL